MVKLCFCLLLYQGVSSSMDLRLKNETLFNDNANNILEKFFADLKTAYLRNDRPRHIAIAGASDEDLRQAKPLLESYPYIICRGTEKCNHSHQFGRGSFVVVYFNDLTEESVRNKYQILSRCKKCKVLFLYNGNVRVRDIWPILTRATRQNARHVRLAHPVNNTVQLYSSFIAKNCSLGIRLATVWRPGVSLNRIHTWSSKLLNNLNGCKVVVSSLTFKPKMMIAESNNGSSLTIVGGRDGKLLLAAAEKLNFTIDLRYPSVVDRQKFSRKMSIINDVISGIAEIGIGRILPTNNLHEMVAFSAAYDEECVTWGVPLVTSTLNNIVGIEFSWQVWIPFGLIFAVLCLIGYADQSLNSSTKRRRESLGFVAVALDVLAIHLGNPMVNVFSSSGGKCMLVAYLYYAMIMTTVYKSYLSAILSSNQGVPMFVDVEDIVNSNINVGGSLYDYDILQNQANESMITAKLLARFKIENNDTVSLHRLKYDTDYAFLARLSSLNFQKLITIRAGKRITFDTLNGCVLSYHTVIVIRKTSLMLREAIDNIILRLLESGLFAYWDLDEIYAAKISKEENFGNNHEIPKNFLTIFVLYSVCMALCLVVFFIEILVGKLNSRKRQHVANPGL